MITFHINAGSQTLPFAYRIPSQWAFLFEWVSIFGLVKIIVPTILYVSDAIIGNQINLKSLAKMNRLINFLNDIDMDPKTERIIEGELEPNLIE